MALPNPLRRFRVHLILGALVFVSGAYFYNGANWNQLSRYNVIFSCVEPGTSDYLTLHMDHFLPDPPNGENTGDWANNPQHDNHYYSNKAPGLILLGIAAYAPLYIVERALGWDPQEVIPSFVNAYLLNLLMTVLPLALAIPSFYQLLLSLSAGTPGRALAVTLILYFGTLLFPYSTQLWGHATAAAAIIVALYGWQKRTTASLLLCGLWAGLAVLMDYMAIVTVVCFGVVLLAGRRWRLLTMFALGGLGPLLIYLLYHGICFGQPFSTGTFFNNPYYHDGEKVLGIFTSVQWEALWGLLFSRYRGLFWYTPILLLALVGLGCWLARGSIYRSLAALIVLNFLGYLALNVSFNGWHGGACVGPRYLVPVLPFLALPLVALPGKPWVAGLCLALAMISCANMTVLTTITTFPPSSARDPLRSCYIAFARGWFKPYGYRPLRLHTPPRDLAYRYSTFNLGEWLGLTRWWSLLPWGLLLAAGGTLLVRAPESPTGDLQTTKDLVT